MSIQVKAHRTSLSRDLEDLQHKIQSVRLVLLDEEIFTPTTAKPILGYTDPVPAVKVSRLSQFRVKCGFTRRRSSPSSSESNTDTTVDETEHSTSDIRSVDSAITLVDDSPISKNDDSTYLTLLAPLIATLQRLSPLVQTSDHEHIKASFLKRCDEMSDLLKELKRESFCPLPGQKADDESDDMRLLLLTALHKKILVERNRCSAPQTNQRSSPLASVLDQEELADPFSVRSSSLTTLVPRTPSPPKRIAPTVPLQPGGFSDFMGHSQATWRRDVHRLGSFQASALFSPGPIAVIKAIGAGVVKL